MNELELLEQAIGIAVQAHRGQRGRYGAPLILHPLRVMGRVHAPRDRIVAVLHDLVEKTDWTFEKLKNAGFPDDLIESIRHSTTGLPAHPTTAVVTPSARVTPPAGVRVPPTPPRPDPDG